MGAAGETKGIYLSTNDWAWVDDASGDLSGLPAGRRRSKFFQLMVKYAREKGLVVYYDPYNGTAELLIPTAQQQANLEQKKRLRRAQGGAGGRFDPELNEGRPEEPGV